MSYKELVEAYHNLKRSQYLTSATISLMLGYDALKVRYWFYDVLGYGLLAMCIFELVCAYRMGEYSEDTTDNSEPSGS